MGKIPNSGDPERDSGEQSSNPAKPEATGEPRPVEPDPLLALRGTGKALWADEHADEYVRRLREDCD